MQDFRGVGKALSVFAALASILGLVSLFRDFLNVGKDTALLITNGTMSALVLLLFLGTLFREWSIARKERYADVMGRIHMCLHRCRDLQSVLLRLRAQIVSGPKPTQRQVEVAGKKLLMDILDDFAGVYSMLTGTNCRACVKTVYSNKSAGKLYVQALARDKASGDACAGLDRLRFDENMDPLEHNTDFVGLYDRYSSSERCFFSNDLSREFQNGYVSTSVAAYKKFLGTKNGGSSLPYRSTMVWPIQQKQGNQDLPRDTCLGFLAVDSPSRNVFIRKWDFEIGAGISDSLFHVLKLYSDILAELEAKP